MEGAKSADMFWLAKRSQYDDWLDAQEVMTSSYGVKNAAVAINLNLKLVERNLTQPQEGYANPEDGRRMCY